MGSAGFAQAVNAPYRYTVRQGDTLLGLARQYMTSEAAYRTVQDLNKVRDPRNLPTGSILLVPGALLRTEPIVGQIASFRGAVTVDGRIAALGAKVLQGMRVETGPNAFVTLQLPDGSAISLPSQSRIYVEKLRRVLLTGSLDRSFRLEAGRSQSTVTPIRDPSSNFRVTTPLSVSAVRGTNFRVALDASGNRALTEVVGGTVGVAPDADKPEKSIPKEFGVAASPEGVGDPVPLLPRPQLVSIERTKDGAVAVTARPVDGAQKYRTQLATDVVFHDIFEDVINDAPAATFALSGDISFFVRLTAIAPSGMEGLPGTYALGRTAPLESSVDVPIARERRRD